MEHPVRVLLVNLVSCLAAGFTMATPSMAEPVVKLEVSVALESESLMLGEPGYLRFVVRNPGPRDLRATVGGDYRNRLGRPESFSVKVTDENGFPVPQPDAGPGFGGLSYGVDLPVDGEHVFELFLPNWATFERPGTYTIAVSRDLTVVTGKGDVFEAESRSVPVMAETTVEIVPLDEARMGRRIAELGKVVVDREHPQAERAGKLLAAIDDVRVIPFYAKLAGMDHQSPRYAACEPLGRYDDSDALEALIQLARTSGADVRKGATTLALAESAAANVRHAAAVALARSPHPKARTELWKLQYDAYYGVRMTVLHAAAKDESPEAAAVILQLVNDGNDLVRNEARRYAAER